MEENEAEWKKMRRNGKNRGGMKKIEEEWKKIEEEWKQFRRNERN